MILFPYQCFSPGTKEVNPCTHGAVSNPGQHPTSVITIDTKRTDQDSADYDSGNRTRYGGNQQSPHSANASEEIVKQIRKDVAGQKRQKIPQIHNGSSETA